jgi:hypothetical protein
VNGYTARASPRFIGAPGALLSAGAALWFSFIEVNTSYWLHLAPGIFILALGFGLGIIALIPAAVYHAKEQETGIAPALLTPPNRSASPWACRFG